MSRRSKKPKSPIFLVLSALGMVAAVVLVLRGFQGRTVESLLEIAQVRLDARDYPGTLRELDLAMQAAVRRGDPAVVGDVLRMRADTYRRRGALDAALLDYQRILAEFPPEGYARAEIYSLISLVMGRAERYEEAVEVCRQGLELYPGSATLLMHLAEARAQEAEAILADLTDRFRAGLASAPAREAIALAKRLASLEVDDPLSIALAHDLTALFPPEKRAETEAFQADVARAARLNSEARSAYAQSFQGYVSVRSVGGLMGLVADSGRQSELVDLGLALLPLPATERDPVALQLLADALEQRGRPDSASQVIDRLLASDQSVAREFKPRWCHILRGAEQWKRLEQVAQELRERPGPGVEAAYLENTANFYLGLARLKLGRFEAAKTALSKFTQSDQFEPFPGARGEGFLALAEVFSTQALYENERLALETGLDFAPDLSGDAWLRLADLLSQQGARARSIEHALAHAMRLLPQRREELTGRWREAGERAAVERGVDFVLLYKSLREQQRWFPSVAGGSYELYHLASQAYANERYHGAAEASRRLLEEYPHFGPGIDLLLQSLLQAGALREAAEVMLGELEFRGGDTQLADGLHALPPGTLDDGQVLRLMRADPGRTGLLTVSRGLREADRQRQALQGLARADSERLGDEGRVVIAQIWIDLSYWEQALGVLESVAPESPFYSTALRLKVEAALNVRKPDVVEGVLAEVASAEVLDRDELLPVVDRLLNRGHWNGAAILLDRLDALPATRGGDVMLRQAVTALSAGDIELTREHLDRAEAYRPDGGPGIGRLLLEIEQRQWTHLPRTVRELWNSELVPTPFQEAIFLALEERVGESSELLEALRVAYPLDARLGLAAAAVAELSGVDPSIPAEWGARGATETELLLHGSDARPRDARDVLGLLLSLDVPEWTVWALSRLSQMESTQLWTTQLRASAYLALGEDVPARQFLRLVTTRWPDFSPAWASLERLEEQRLGRPDHPEMLELRAERRAALGDVAGEEAERALAAASRLADAGRLEQALAGARAARELQAYFAPADLLIARTASGLGRLMPAVEAYANYVLQAGSDAGDDVIDEFLAVLDLAGAEGTLSPQAQRAELGALELDFPEHPGIALAQAALELRTAAAGPSAGLGRAILHLEEFRAATGQRPLDGLRPGSTEAWCSFLLDYDPERAERLVQNELSMQPESLDLWLLLGRTLEAQGRLHDAVEHYQTIRQMLPDTRGMRRLASLLAEFGGREREVTELLETIQKLEVKRRLDDDLVFVKAHAQVNASVALRNRGIDQLAILWEARERAGTNLDPTELGIRYGFSLAQRGRYEDRTLARDVLMTVLPGVRDKARADLVLAVAYLVHYLPKPDPIEQPAPAQEALPDSPPGSPSAAEGTSAAEQGASSGTAAPTETAQRLSPTQSSAVR